MFDGEVVERHRVRKERIPVRGLKLAMAALTLLNWRGSQMKPGIYGRLRCQHETRHPGMNTERKVLVSNGTRLRCR